MTMTKKIIIEWNETVKNGDAFGSIKHHPTAQKILSEILPFIILPHHDKHTIISC